MHLRVLERIDEFVLEIFWHEDIVWSDASLTSIDNLAPEDPLRSSFQVTVRVDENGRFALARQISVDRIFGTDSDSVLPPSSNETGVRCLAAAALTIRATRPPPV